MEVNAPGPVQDQETLLACVLPTRVIVGSVQVIVSPVAVAPGATSSRFTLAVAKAVHPFAGLVTVRIYDPGSLTVGLGKFEVKLFGPDQTRVAPGVVELPLITRDETVQSSVPPLAEAFGILASGATVAVAVVVQPFGPVTVRI